jgi:hypothetical protein
MGGKPAAKLGRKKKREMRLLEILPIHFLTEEWTSLMSAKSEVVYFE